MANTFKPKKEEPIQEREQPSPPKQSPRPKAKSPRASRPVQGTGIHKGIKTLRKGFESIFGGGILQKINIRKNWGFILFVVVLVIILINSNLKIQSKRLQIEKLKKEVIVAKDEAMDAVEKWYNIDKQREKEVLKEGEERGFHNNGYLPYIVEVEKSKK